MSDPIQRKTSAMPSLHELDDASREQCMRYLLGSMDTQETSQFERRLESEPAMGEELVAQSELICQLASDEISLPISSVSRVSPLSVGPLSVGTSAHGTRFAVWVRYFASMAACLLAVFALWSARTERSRQTEKQITLSKNLPPLDEELLIAQAWADGPLSLALTSSSIDADIEDSVDDLTTDQESLEPSEDSVLNWMMVAVTAGAHHEG